MLLRFNKHMIYFGVLLLITFVYSSTNAQESGSISGTIDVSITLEPGCTVNDSAGPTNVEFGSINFGTHSTLFTQADGQALYDSGNIEIICTPGLSPSFKITQGSNDGDAIAPATHAMADTGEDHYVSYDIFQDSGRSQKIVNNTSYPLDGTADGETPQIINIYARAYGSGGLVDGVYKDTLQIELEF